jgi:transcription initiation factor TFIIA small subunit
MMCEEIGKRNKSKCTIKGVVKNYKNCDDIWIFYAENVYLRTEHENFTSQSLKVVACDSQMKAMMYEGAKKKDYSANEEN